MYWSEKVARIFGPGPTDQSRALKNLYVPQVKRAIGWLRVRDRERELQVESKLAACLILKEMAQNSPAVFNVHVKGFIDVIWNSLRHPSREIREAAVQALSVRH